MANQGYPLIPSMLRFTQDGQMGVRGGARLPLDTASQRQGVPVYGQMPQRVGDSVMPTGYLTPAQKLALAQSSETAREKAIREQAARQQVQQGGFFDGLPSLTSPAGQALGAFGSTALQLSGYQDRPMTIGAGLGAAMQAAREAYTAAEDRQAKNYLDELKAATALVKATDKGTGEGFFTSKSFTANKYNTLLSVGQKIKDGTATPEERLAYRLSYQDLSQPRTETRTTDEGTTTVNVPALDLSAFPTPEGLKPAQEEQIGKVSKAFTDVQSRAASFAVRLKEQNDIFDALIDAGYDPTNVRDQTAQGAGATYAMTTQGQQYDAAKRNFINAQLRRESGAAIAASEFANADKQYFPQLGDSQEVIEQKRKARQTAFNAMKSEAGTAYDVLFLKPDDTDNDASGLPKGSTLFKTINGKKFYKAPDGSIYVVE